MNKKIGIFVVVVVVVGGIWLAGSKKQQEGVVSPSPQGAVENVTPPVGEVPEQSVNGTNSGAGQVARVKEFIVIGQNYSFLPSTLTVEKGDTVRITFKNSGGFHDLNIEGYNVATKQIQGGAEETIQFIADKVGSFEYFCSVGNHRAMGMKGTLTVVESE